jgi:hypothetical protein
MKITPELCIKCKGKLLCGLKTCPIIEKNSSQTKIVSKIKDNEFEGATPPGFFVSWQNYPKVAVAPLSSLPEELSPISDSPEQWYGLPQEEIIKFRESLLRSYKTMPVDLASNPSYELVDFQELAMSKNLVDVNINLKKAPKTETSFDSFSAPMGPSAALNKIKANTNPKIDKKLDYFYNDTDIKSKDALIELYNHGTAISTLSKVLSSGALGQKKKRKLVPTRWSITAVDSNLSKYFIEEKIVQNKVIDSFKLFNSNYLDNNFWIMLMPYPFSFENIECWLPGGVWNFDKKDFKLMSDHELSTGIKGYPKETEGAYFASRIGVCEYLVDKKLNAAAIVFREIGDGYAMPLGVWQIRENVRAAMANKPFEFSSMDLALEFLSKKLSVPLKQYKEKSKLIKHFKTQTRLSQWF